MATGLTIGQAASFAGVTIKTVRHYHRLGLVAEPRRDTSGYRRYTSVELLRLVQVRTLAEAGVPLAEIGGLLDADPERFAERLADVDRQLAARIRALEHRRATLHKLADGDRALLPDRACAALDRFAEMGLDAAFTDANRESMILLRSVAPEVLDGFLDHLDARFADPEHVDLLRRSWIARDWEPDDPRVDALAAELAENLLKNRPLMEANAHLLADPTAARHYVAVEHHGSDGNAVMERLNQLVAERLRDAGVPAP